MQAKASWRPVCFFSSLFQSFNLGSMQHAVGWVFDKAGLVCMPRKTLCILRSYELVCNLYMTRCMQSICMRTQSSESSTFFFFFWLKIHISKCRMQKAKCKTKKLLVLKKIMWGWFIWYDNPPYQWNLLLCIYLSRRESGKGFSIKTIVSYQHVFVRRNEYSWCDQRCPRKSGCYCFLSCVGWLPSS